jgi:hypothetical protein
MISKSLAHPNDYFQGADPSIVFQNSPAIPKMRDLGPQQWAFQLILGSNDCQLTINTVDDNLLILTFQWDQGTSKIFTIYCH